MADESHCLLLRDAGACEASYDRYACAMERKMGQTYAAKKTVPIARSLRWHVIRHPSAFLFHLYEERTQGRDKRGRVTAPAFNRERDLICSGVDVCQRKARLAKAAALANGDFKGSPHPFRLSFQLFPDQRFFSWRDFLFFFRTIGGYPEFGARIYGRESPGDRFEKNDAPDANIEQCAVQAGRAKSRVFGRMLAPLEILDDMLSFQLSWPPHILGLKKRGYCVPSLAVFCKSVWL